MKHRSRKHAWLSEWQYRLCLQIPTLTATWWCRVFSRPKTETGVRSLLVVRLDGIGDCVMTLPLLAHLRLCYPAASITVVTRPLTEALFRCSDDVSEVLTFDPTPQRTRANLLQTLFMALRFFFSELWQRKFDVALSPRWDIDISMATFLCAMTRAPVRVGYEDGTTPTKLHANKGFERAFTTILPAGPVRHEVLRNLEVACAAGCVRPVSGPRIVVTSEEWREPPTWLQGPKAGLRIALGVAAGSARRRWTADRYVALLEALLIEGPVSPVVFVDDETAAVGDEIVTSFPGASLMKRMSLLQVAAVLAECDVFVGGDSGLGHIAAAVGCATVTVSPHPVTGKDDHTNSPIRFRPWGDRSVVVQPAKGGEGCLYGCERDEPHCILNIDVNEVASAVKMVAGASRQDESVHEQGPGASHVD